VEPTSIADSEQATSPYSGPCTANIAVDILGRNHNSKGVSERNMIKARQIASIMHTQEETNRLAAAIWAKKNAKAFQSEQKARQERNSR